MPPALAAVSSTAARVPLFVIGISFVGNELIDSCYYDGCSTVCVALGASCCTEIVLLSFDAQSTRLVTAVKERKAVYYRVCIADCVSSKHVHAC
jgi:hypothetical protein